MADPVPSTIVKDYCIAIQESDDKHNTLEHRAVAYGWAGGLRAAVRVIYGEEASDAMGAIKANIDGERG